MFSIKRLEYFLVCLVFALLPFENSPLQGSPLGYAGASLSVFPILLLVTLNLHKILSQRELLVFVTYSALISLIYAIIYSSKPTQITIIQGGKQFILYLLFFLAYLYFKNTEVPTKKPTLILLSVSALSLAASLFLPELTDSASIIHFTETRNYRPRGFSLEASTYGFLCISAILLFSWQYKIPAAASFTLSLAVALTIQSKGTASAILITATLVYITKNKPSIIFRLLFAPTIIIAFILASNLLKSAFISDIESYTSVATRLTMAVTAIASIFSSPLGHGFPGFLPYIHESGASAVGFVNALSPLPLNYNEVYTYLSPDSVENVGTKTLFFDSLIILGLPFAIFYITQLRRIANKANNQGDSNKLSLCIFVFLSLTFFIPGIGNYSAAVVLGLLANTKQRQLQV